MLPWQIKAYEKRAKEVGYEFITFRSYDTALMWDVFDRMSITLFITLLFVWVLYETYPTNPYAISVSYLAEIIAMIVILRGWLTLMSNSNPYKNCWWEPGKD